MIAKAEQWPRWMSKKTAAVYADVTPPTLERWLKLGLPYVKTCTGSTRIDRVEFDAWMAKRQTAEAVAS